MFDMFNFKNLNINDKTTWKKKKINFQQIICVRKTLISPFLFNIIINSKSQWYPLPYFK